MEGLKVVYKDEDMIAIDKPYGLRSTPAFLKGTDGTSSTDDGTADSSGSSSSKRSATASAHTTAASGAAEDGGGSRKRRRQERFSDVLQSLSGPGSTGVAEAAAAASSSTATTFDLHLQKLARESSNVPRKKKTFRSYAKRSLHIDDEREVERLWDLIQAAVLQEEEREGMRLTDSVLTRIQAAEAPEARAVHRLDCETSGVMLVALTEAAGKELDRQFRNGEVKKTYRAVVHGRLPQPSGTISRAIRPDPDDRPRQVVDDEGGKASTTQYSRIEAGDAAAHGDFDWVEVKPITGRTHQIRVHLLSIGHAIVGDTLYEGEHGASVATGACMPDGERRLLLHAQHICFKHPTTGLAMELTAPCPF